MRIRLVRDDGSVFWFTTSNWKRFLRFAGQHGWKWNRELIPGRLGDGQMNDKYEFIGCARVELDAAQSLADAVERGVRDEPQPAFLVKEFDRTKVAVRETLPNCDPLTHAQNVVKHWVTFVPYARAGGFRVDLTD